MTRIALAMSPETELVQRLAVDGDLGAVGIEGEVAPDVLGGGDRRGVAPDDAVVAGAPDLGRPVRGLALERAGRVEGGRLEEIHAYVVGRQVPAGRQAGLVEL